MLTCGDGNEVKLWDTTTGECLLTLNHHKEAVSAVAWGQQGQWFATASLDKQVCLWSPAGKLQHTWFGVRTLDLASSPDGGTLVGVCTTRMMWIYDTKTYRKEW